MSKNAFNCFTLVCVLMGIFPSGFAYSQARYVTQGELDGVRDFARHASSGAARALQTANEANITANAALHTARSANITSSWAMQKANMANSTATLAAETAKSANETAKEARKQNVVTKVLVDRLWVLIAALLVFFMQAGFKCLEVGASRQRHGATVGVMNLMNWLVLCLGFYLIGYGTMFGHQMITDTHGIRQGAHGSYGGFIGNLFMWPSSEALLYKQLGLEYFLFQLAFAATTATIVDGAISERTKLSSYIWILVGISVIIYPIFGHWAWNDYGWLKGIFVHTGNDKTVIQDNPFHDFAGSTVVHSIGAWIALVGIYCVGNRRDRFNKPTTEFDIDPVNPNPRYTFKAYLSVLTIGLSLAFGVFLPRNKQVVVDEVQDATNGRDQFQPHNLGYSVLGVIMLWFGWWGFNGGSKLEYSYSIANIILHTNLAGASAGIAAYIYALRQGDMENLYPKVLGGVLGGLVAITASCDVANPGLAIFIGAVAGIIHNRAYDFLLTRKIDDVAGAIPVHGTCGVWGTLMAGIAFCWNSLRFRYGWDLLAHQMLVQFIGVIAAFVWATAVAWCLFSLVDKTLGVKTD